MYIENKYRIDPLQNHLFLFRSRKKKKDKDKIHTYFYRHATQFFREKASFACKINAIYHLLFVSETKEKR